MQGKLGKFSKACLLLWFFSYYFVWGGKDVPSFHLQVGHLFSDDFINFSRYKGGEKVSVCISASAVFLNSFCLKYSVCQEAEDIKKRWQEYTEQIYKKDLHDPYNHDAVVTHLEPDILEYEVKWALGSITMNKASGDGIPVELFQILKDDGVKVLHSICQQIWKTRRWPQGWKRSVYIPVPKKGNAKECSTTTQFHSSHKLAK